MQSILKDLNKEQLKAVKATEGYVRVIAGAGTGKTKTLTHRYAYLVEELGISPSNILCLTFTNKAANEMKSRVKSILGSDFDTSFLSTIHSFCVRVLREEISKLFYPESFIVLDTADQKSILEEVYDEMKIKADSSTFKDALERIGGYKNKISYVKYLADPDFDYSTLTSSDDKEEIIFRYIKKQRKYFGLDFFDLINFTIYLFRSYPSVLSKWQKKFCYIMVDEFQDITVKEFKLIRKLSEYHKNLFVVGDPDQNIYEWRGSDVGVIVDFEKRLNDDCFLNRLNVKVQDVILNENYRSYSPILSVANSIIQNNENRVKKDLFTNKEGGDIVEYLHAKNEREEADYICDKIKRRVKGGGKYSDFAVLYRSSYLSRFIEQGFLEKNIPYAVYGGVGFYERAEIKDVLSYMRLVLNPDDDLSFKRIINVPRRKIGKTKLLFVTEYADKEKIPLYAALKRTCDLAVFKGSKAKEFVNVIENLRPFVEELSVSDLLQKILKESGYEGYIRESGDEDRLDNVAELLRSIIEEEKSYGEYFSLATFLQNITLLRDSDVEEKSDRVKIMTIHTSKGLEFKEVFLVGLTEGVFPSSRSLNERQDEALEEERRLCFVAVTRAKERLYLTESEGFRERVFSKTPSRFLFEIDDDLLLKIGKIPDEIKINCKIPKKKTTVKTEVFKKGCKVLHKVFGEGEVVEVDAAAKTYHVKFASGVKPISFSYEGLKRA